MTEYPQSEKTHLPAKVVLIKFVYIEQQLISTMSFKDSGSANILF